MDRSTQVAWLMNGVGIREQQPTAASRAGGCPDRIRLSRPAFLEFGRLQHSDAHKAPGDFGGPIGRMIIDDDKLPVAAQLEHCLGLRR